MMQIPYGKDGIPVLEQIKGISPEFIENGTPDELRGWNNASNGVAAIYLSVISLINCRNVTVEPSNDRFTPRESKYLKGRFGPRKSRADYEFHTIRINGRPVPFRQSNGKSGTTIDAEFMVRGHFKLFTPERPLFGKYAGPIWWCPAIHGKGKKRKIDKQYSVDPSPK